MAGRWRPFPGSSPPVPARPLSGRYSGWHLGSAGPCVKGCRAGGRGAATPAPPRGPAPKRSALPGAQAGAPGRPAGAAPSSSGSSSDAGPGPLRPWPAWAPRKFGAGLRRRGAAGPMEARGELGPSRESAGGDLLLALLARREDLRRGGCSGVQRPRRIGQTFPPRDPEVLAPFRPGHAIHGTHGTGWEWVRGPQHPLGTQPQVCTGPGCWAVGRVVLGGRVRRATWGPGNQGQEGSREDSPLQTPTSSPGRSRTSASDRPQLESGFYTLRHLLRCSLWPVLGILLQPGPQLPGGTASPPALGSGEFGPFSLASAGKTRMEAEAVWAAGTGCTGQWERG